MFNLRFPSRRAIGWLGLLTLTILPTIAFPITHHELQVWLQPDTGELRVIDQLVLDADRQSIDFSLGNPLSVSAPDGIELRELEQGDRYTRYRLTSSQPTRRFRVEIKGRVKSPTLSSGNGYDRGITANRGHIDSEGVYLGPETGWYADTGELLSFDVNVSMPKGWMAVSQGRGQHAEGRSQWSEPSPQQGIFLVANRFKRYADGRAEVYLRTADAALAERYIKVTHHYLERYEELLGSYPYAKFALVENTWESGFGMPSFTLLGSRVIRLPFILHSSYPHEILHNWWGNGVYLGYGPGDLRGNWSEGLTTYLADHAIQAERGQGASYRRRLLQRFADHAGSERDFPLSRFVARHSDRAQAVGYGKATMVFHMLRERLGPALFDQGLRHFYAAHRFRFAGWSDIRRSMEAVSDQDLTSFFARWIEGRGMARISVELSSRDARELRISLNQASPFLPLTVPVRVQHGDDASWHSVTLDGASASLAISEPATITSIQVDPHFSTFRALQPGESPLAISALLGAERISIVLPSEAPQAMRTAYRKLANQWVDDERIRITLDTDQPPGSGAVWLLGRENRLRDRLLPGFDGDTLTLDGERYRWGEQTTVVTAAQSTEQPVGLIDLQMPAAWPAIARKLPHYGRYGYLLFQGSEAINLLRGEWPVRDSPLMIKLDQGGKPRPAPTR